MTLAVRVIPCLDVADGRVVKGLRFENLRDAGDPVEAAARYESEGADELAFLDIAAATENRGTLVHLVSRVAEVLSIPLTVGGGVRSVEEASALLKAGADRVTLNTAAVRHPDLITAIAERYGAQCVVVAVDGKRVLEPDGGMRMLITTHGGRKITERDVASWVTEATDRGAGEILLSSVDADGTRGGFDLEMLRVARQATAIPIIASGGAGRPEHFVEAVLSGGADAVLAASVFHDRIFSIAEVKRAMSRHGVPVRPVARAFRTPIAYDARGLVPVVVRDVGTGRVLMLAYTNEEAIERTLETGRSHFFSRSRNELWEKGATSGNTQRVTAISVDCDADAVLYDVVPAGPACHTGAVSCFSQVERLDAATPARPELPWKSPPAKEPVLDLAPLFTIIAERGKRPEPGSYTNRLLDSGVGRIAKKVGEEGVEVALAAIAESDDALAGEIADLLYHVVVLMQARELDPSVVNACLKDRASRRTKP
jgi:cyclase